MNNESINDVCDHVTKNVRKAIVQKGNALLGLGELNKAEQCFELLREFGKGATADRYLKKVRDAKVVSHTSAHSTTVIDQVVTKTNSNQLIYSKFQI